MSGRQRKGLTLVEVLVVVAIIGLLIGLLRGIRGSAQLLEMELHDKELTEYTQVIIREADRLQTLVDRTKSAFDAVNRPAAGTVVPIYRCPSFPGTPFAKDPLYVALGSPYALRNYVAMGATTAGKLYWEPAFKTPETQDGSIYPQSRTRFRDITDGLSHTVLLSETREQNAAAWIDGSTASITSRRIDPSNAPTYTGPENALNYVPYYRYGGGQSIDMEYGPSSAHAGVVSQLSADGAVQFMVDSTAPSVYDGAVTRAGGD